VADTIAAVLAGLAAGALFEVLRRASVTTILAAISALLLLIGWRLGRIERYLKRRFPTAKQRDYEWSQMDPGGH
jgi:hypothetical protein